MPTRRTRSTWPPAATPLTDSTDGNLLIHNLTGGVTKTFILNGTAQATTIIQGGDSWDDRIFQIVSTPTAAVAVTMKNLAIEGGNAFTAGAVGGTAALGGGMLVDGGQVTLSHVGLSSNNAWGFTGAAGRQPARLEASGELEPAVAAPVAARFISRPGH